MGKVNNGPGTADLLSAAAWIGTTQVPAGHMWIGGYSDMSNQTYGGWRWVDGTADANINCGSVGCGPFGLGQPK
jgi:hypothetical protein